MAEKVTPIKQSTAIEMQRITLHESVPDIASSKTLSHQTAPGIKISYESPSPILHIEFRGKPIFMPITNVKAMFPK